VRGDLIRILEALLRRPGRFDAIIIETTGLADPTPVAQTFFLDDDIRFKTKLDAVIALVDAMNLPSRLKDSAVAENQIAFADVIVLNKTDLVTEKELHAIETRLRAINPGAIIHRTVRAAVSLPDILNRNAFDLSKLEGGEARFLGENDDGHNHDREQGHHVHDTTIQTISLRGGEMDSQRFIQWITRVAQQQGQNILRLKGIIAFKDNPDRYVIQGVHMIIEGVYDRAWRSEETHQSRLVFIGRQLDFELLRNSFSACQLP
jgi:G3E family GTPase